MRVSCLSERNEGKSGKSRVFASKEYESLKRRIEKCIHYHYQDSEPSILKTKVIERILKAWQRRISRIERFIQEVMNYIRKDETYIQVKVPSIVHATALISKNWLGCSQVLLAHKSAENAILIFLNILSETLTDPDFALVRVCSLPIGLRKQILAEKRSQVLWVDDDIVGRCAATLYIFQPNLLNQLKEISCSDTL